MARYRVRDGYALAHGGEVHQAGTVLELSRALADDPAIRGHVEEIDDQGNPVAPVPVDELARFRTHERIGFLQQQLAAANDRVSAIKARLADEEATLEREVAAAAAARQADAAQTDTAGTTSADSIPTGKQSGRE